MLSCMKCKLLLYVLMQEKQVDHQRKLKEKVKTPEGVPRLFDLVTVKDEKLKLAFFAALGNTVVAKDLDQVKFSTLFMTNSILVYFKISIHVKTISCFVFLS